MRIFGLKHVHVGKIVDGCGRSTTGTGIGGPSGKKILVKVLVCLYSTVRSYALRLSIIHPLTTRDAS
jgi:hypothetical protein